MIITDLNSPELSLYAGLNQYFAKMLEIAKEAMESPAEVGKYALDGDKAYYLMQEYDTKSVDAAKFETHKRYIDIQIVLEGAEQIRFETVDELDVMTEYNAEKDCALYFMNKTYDSVNLLKGQVAIIFPEEAHAPCVSMGDTPTHVRKMVAKILY